MSKVMKYSLIVLVAIVIFLSVAYFRGQSLAEKEKTEAIERAQKLEFEIVSEETNVDRKMFHIYYTDPNPTVQDMKDLAAYLIYEKSQGMNYVGVSICDDRASALVLANPSEEGISDEEWQQRSKSAFEHYILSWDSLDYKIMAGKNYKYLDGLDVRL